MHGSCWEHFVVAPTVAKAVFVVVSIVVLLCRCFGLEFVAIVCDVVCAFVLEVGSYTFLPWTHLFMVLNSVIYAASGVLNLALQ